MHPLPLREFDMALAHMKPLLTPISQSARPSETTRHPVIDLILDRARSNSRPGLRRDHARLGLAFEGGGMRGITSAGMGFALVQLGLTDVFDVVYGSSAGALNSAYFVSGQGALGFSIYYEDINNDRFISLRRALLGRTIVSLDCLFHDAMTISKPLDFDSVVRSPIPLRILAANLTRRTTTVFDHFRSREDLLLKLRASAAMPFLAGPPIQIDGELYSDASLYESIPFRSAVDAALTDACTHMLILRSRPEGVVRPEPSFFDRWLGRSLGRHGAGLYEDYLGRSKRYSADVAALKTHTEEGVRQPHLYQVMVPKDTPVLPQLERRRDRLVDAAAVGMKAMVAALTGSEPKVMELITPLRSDGRPVVL